MLQLFVVFATKLLLLTGNKDYIHIKLPKECYFLKYKAFDFIPLLYTDNKVKLLYIRESLLSRLEIIGPEKAWI